MAGLLMLIVYTILIGVLELHFHVTVGHLVERLIHLLAGSR